MTTSGIVWCPHCRDPHKLGEKFCPKTGRSIDQRVHRSTGLPPRRHPLIGAVVGDKYEVVRRIGAGGMGEVFEAYSHSQRRSFALKIATAASDQAASRLRREARVIASIEHPNICDVYEVGSLADGSPYLVLELLEGETLEQLLRREHRLSIAGAVELFVQILDGLHCAHLAGIVHRDLKPANVFLVERRGLPPLVKVLDFGFAKDLSGRMRTVTLPGRTCGTPEYMSPEQLFAEPVDPSSDLFSVGIMLFQALAGRHPFASSSVAETSIKIAREPPLLLRQLRERVPPELADVVHRALEKDPSARPKSALAMRLSLAALQNSRDDAPDSCADGHGIPRLLTSSSSLTAH